MSDFFMGRDQDYGALFGEPICRDGEAEAGDDEQDSDARQPVPGSDHSDFCGRECGALGPSGLLLVD